MKRLIVLMVLCANLVYAFSFGKNVVVEDEYVLFDVKNLNIKNEQINTYTNKNLFTCDKELNGFYEFKSTSSIALYPSKKLRSGTKYTCFISKDFSKKPSSISFTTKALHVKSATIQSAQSLLIRFSDKVNEEDFLKNITLQKENKLSLSKLEYKITSTDGYSFLLSTAEDMKKILLHVNKNISSNSDVKIANNLDIKLQIDEVSYQTNKHTKTMILYDKPSWGTSEDGKIVLRIFMKEYIYSSSNIHKFIKIKGLDNFSVSQYKYVETKMQKKYNLNEKSWNYIDIIGDFLPNTTYELSLKKGFGNQEARLAKDESFTIKTGDFGHYVGFLNDKPYLSNFGDIGIESVNTNEVLVSISRLSDQNLRYFTNFDENNVNAMSETIYEQKISLDNEKNVFTNHKISLSDVPKALKSGIYQISLTSHGKKAVKNVYLSDIGISAKVYKDGIFVFLSSLKDAKGLKDVHVKVYSSKNALIAEGTSDENGIFEFKKQNFSNPRSIIATKNDDKNFLVLNQPLENKSLDMLLQNDKKDFAFVYFQSELVRVDENLSALIVLKDKFYKSIKNAPLHVSIKDPTSKIVYEKNFQTSKNGALSLVIPLLGQKTGQYEFEVKFQDKIIATKSFLVEAFLPQKIKNSIHLPSGFVKTNSILEVNASSEYLFGAPASFLKGTLRIKAISKEYKNDKFKNFTFENKIAKNKNTSIYIDQSKNITLDKNGKAKALLSTKSNPNAPSILDAQIELSILDDARAVSAYKNIDIYPYDFLVGLKTQNKITDTNTPILINTLLINPFTNEVKQDELEVFVKKRTWHYSFSDGHYKWREELVDVEHFTIKANEDIQKTFAQSGDYVILVKHISGHSASMQISVRGWDYASLNPTNKMDENQVSFEDKLYKKGDILKLDIKTPIKKGTMLVTLEGSSLLWHKVVEFENSHVKVDIALQNDMKEDLHVSTYAIRSSDVEDSLIPFRASSLSLVLADKTAHLLKPKIISQDLVNSNTSLHVSVVATPNSQVLISLVDDGILQILDQQPPNPFEYFNIKAKNKIAQYDMYDKLSNFIVKGKKLNFGSGAVSLSAMKKHLSPKTSAKRLKPFVYFSKLLDVGDSSEVSVDIKVPSSYNASATIVAIEINENAIGATSKKLVVKDEISLKPIFPRFGSIGDEWEVLVRVFNTTNEALHVSIQTQTNELLKANFQDEFSINANSSKLLQIPFKVLGFGAGYAKFQAKANDKTYEYEISLPLIYPYTLSTFNVQNTSSKSVEIKLPKEYEKDAKFSLNVSGDVLYRLKSHIDDLVEYPYGCSEQTSSKILAMQNIDPFLTSLSENELNAKLNDKQKFINSGIEKLLSLQKPSGAFAYWEQKGYVNDFASIFASDVILEAKENGYNLATYANKAILNSLKDFSKSNNSFIKIYATYLLATQNIVDIANVNYIYDKKLYQDNFVNIFMMAYILKQARMTSEMNAVLKYGYNFPVNNSKQKSEYFSTPARDLGFALYLHVKHFGKNKHTDLLYSNLQKYFNTLYSTQEKAFVLRAVREYFKDYKSSKNKFEIKINNTNETYEFNANIQGTTGKQIKIVPKGGYINYNFSASKYLPKKIKHEKLSNKTLSIYREFIDEFGNLVDLNNIKLGQKIYSKVQIKTNEDINNIVINEQIPSCFEIINQKFNKMPSKFQNTIKTNFTDIQDDKVLNFISLKANQTQTFYTKLNASIKGTCTLPAIMTEAMYDERISDYDLQSEFIKVR